MKSELHKYAETVILRWYAQDPVCFDTKGNNEWLILYVNKWLGGNVNTWFAKERLGKMPYETFRRVTQALISTGTIKISEKNMTARHRKEIKLREDIMLQGKMPERKEPVKYIAIDPLTGRSLQI